MQIMQRGPHGSLSHTCFTSSETSTCVLTGTQLALVDPLPTFYTYLILINDNHALN